MNPTQMDPRRKKLLVYGGVAAALLLAVLFSRRNSPSGAQDPANPPLTPVASPAPDAGTLGAGGPVDNGAELAGFQSAILDQLPTAVSQGVAAGLSGLPAAAAPAGAGPAPIAVTINGGEQLGPGAGGASSAPGPRTKARPHPAAYAQRVRAAIHAAHSGTVKGTVNRSRLLTLAEQHPDWGPHTLAHGGRLRGHSVHF